MRFINIKFIGKQLYNNKTKILHANFYPTKQLSLLPLKKCNNKMNIIQSYFVYDAVIYRMLYDKN